MKQDFLRAATLAGLFALTTTVFSATAAQAKTLRVDDDKVQDKKATFTTIQAAVDAAAPGDTIKVAPGTYNGDISIDVPNLKISGAQSGVSGANQNRFTAVASTTNESIVVTPDNSDGFSLAANNITIDGFYIEARDTGVESDQHGIDTADEFSGYKLQNNVIVGQAVGIFLGSSGASATTISNNAIGKSNAFGEPGGYGIYADTNLTNVVISKNTFAGNSNTQIFVFPGSGAMAAAGKKQPITVTISENTIDGSLSTEPTSLGILVGNIPNVLIAKNSIANIGNTGIFLLQGVTGSTVQGNSITDANGFGVFLLGTGANNLVQNNTIVGSGGSGIFLVSSSFNTLLGNSVRDSGSFGILLSDSDDNLLQNNIVRDNTTVGILLDSGSQRNRITKNTVLGHEFDLRDTSVGNGTAATANFYSKNTFATSTPAGLQ